MKIKVKELNKNFAMFGSVLDWKDARLSSTSENHDYWDGVSEFHSGGTLVCSFLRIKKSIKAQIDEMECHYKTEEILVALEGDIIISVALPDQKKAAPDESTLSCFYLKQGSGVVLKAGLWHALPCTVAPVSSMTLVVFKKNTSYSENQDTPTDIHFAPLKSPFHLEFS
jgi:ureidoglycolate hydrolase